MTDSPVAIVTGCSSGIGLAIAKTLAQNNHTVYAGSRNPSTATNLQNLVQHENLTNIHPIELNVDEDESVKNVINKIIENEEKLDVLVNNAGYGVIGRIDDLPVNEFIKQFQTDLFGPLRMIRSVLPQMKKQNSGRIINISSIAGQIGFPLTSPYICSKFALEGLSESLRQELYETNIITTIIEPGVVKTKFNKNMKFPQNYSSDENKAEAVKLREQCEKIFNRTEITGTDVANVVLESLNSTNPKIRYQVGMDAKQLLDTKRQKTDEDFEHIVHNFFNEIMNIP